MSLSLRAVRPVDRELLREWRNADHVRNVSIDDRSISEEQHDAWFGRVLEGTDSGEHLVVDVNARPVGIVRLEAVDADQGTGSWACHLGDLAVPPGLGASLPVIGLALGFDAWSLRRMSAEVLSVNTNMRGIHRRLRLTEEGVRRQAVRRRSGELIDVHEYGVLSDEWSDLRSRALALFPPVVRADLTYLLDMLAARKAHD